MRRPFRKVDLDEMIGRLSQQLDVLEESCRRAFQERRREYLADVALKLRELTMPGERNTPPLIEVAARVGITPTVSLDGAPIPRSSGQLVSGDMITLDQYFDLKAISIETTAGHASMTARDFICKWSEQLGGAHADSDDEEALFNALNLSMTTYGRQFSAIQLHNMARMILHHGRQVVDAGRERIGDLNRPLLQRWYERVRNDHRLEKA